MASPFAALDSFADHPAVITDAGERLDYRQLLAEADRVGAAVPDRALVMVVCRNDLACLAGYIGLSRAGAVLLLVHHSLPAAQREAIIAAFTPAFLYSPGADNVYRLTPTGHPPVALHDDLCLLLTTSGTTGSRSFVRLSYDNVVSNARSIIDYLAIGADQRAITTMPMSYTYGLSILHSHLLAGASVILTEASLVSPGFWPLFKAHQATSFGGVPFLYEMLLKLRFERMELPSLRSLTQAGGKLDPALVLKLAEICQAKGISFTPMYGQTEATARISYLPWPRALDKAGSIGRAIPGGRLSLVDDAGQPITRPGVAGELIYHGPNVSLGYAQGADDLIRGDEHQGRLATGDLATQDDEGFFTIVGRKKRFVKIFGHRVNLDEVEHLLRQAGYDCACGGDDNALALYLPPGVDGQAALGLLTGITGLNAKGFRLVAVPAIPRNASGKIDYGALRGLA